MTSTALRIAIIEALYRVYLPGSPASLAAAQCAAVAMALERRPCRPAVPSSTDTPRHI